MKEMTKFDKFILEKIWDSPCYVGGSDTPFTVSQRANSHKKNITKLIYCGDSILVMIDQLSTLHWCYYPQFEQSEFEEFLSKQKEGM